MGVSLVQGFIAINEDNNGGGTEYYSYQHNDLTGVYIIVEKTTAGADVTYRYYVGNGGSAQHDADWVGRVGLTYAHYEDIKASIKG